MDVGDRLCNLECLEKGPRVHEFVGPVKIILVEPPKKQYCYRTWFAALLSFANALLHINFILIFFHTVAFKTKFAFTGHIYLCTLGFQYFMFSRMLLGNGLFGPATQMKKPHRNLQQLIVEIAAVFAGAGGVVILVIRSTALFSTAHSIVGVVTSSLTVMSSIVGVPAYFIEKGAAGEALSVVHNVFGSLTVLTSSICFILGLIKPGFKTHLQVQDIYIIMIIFCVIYTLIVSLSPIMRYTDAKM